MLSIGSIESYVAFGSIGGAIGHLIWCERNQEKASSLSNGDHARRVLRYVIVSGFLASLIYLLVLRYDMASDPISYLLVGIVGMLSIDAAVIVLDFSKGAAGDIIRGIYTRLTGK